MSWVSEHSFYRVGREEGCLGEGTSVCKAGDGAVWSSLGRGWFCVARCVYGGLTWEPLDPGAGSGDESVPTGRGQPELRVRELGLCDSSQQEMDMPVFRGPRPSRPRPSDLPNHYTLSHKSLSVSLVSGFWSSG